MPTYVNTQSTVLSLKERTDMSTEHPYLQADEIKPGDVLPTISRQVVSQVTVFPNESVRVVFEDGQYIRHFPHGGPDFGFPAVRISRN
jgi:hypothetical protein